MRQPHARQSAIPLARRFHPATRCVAALAAILLGAPARAAQPTERARFVARHICEIAARLEEIHRRGPVATSRDRFITAAMRGRGQNYVQCIFQDRDTAMYCEASSGAYRSPTDAEPRLHLSPRSVAALNALGFEQRDPRENFSREIALGNPPDVRLAAELMLTALHDAYGADAATALNINAPRGGDPSFECGAPVG